MFNFDGREMFSPMLHDVAYGYQILTYMRGDRTFVGVARSKDGDIKCNEDSTHYHNKRSTAARCAKKIARAYESEGTMYDGAW